VRPYLERIVFGMNHDWGSILRTVVDDVVSTVAGLMTGAIEFLETRTL
jgi:hypothetical protein